MYKIYFYKDKRGKQPVYDYLLELKSKNDKDSRIKLNKHNDYLQALAEFGLKLGEPYIKHLQGDIWELSLQETVACLLFGVVIVLYCCIAL